MDHLVQIILLLGVTVAVMLAFQRMNIPSSLGYLLVGLILGPHTAGPTVHVSEFEALAEFGVVFYYSRLGLTTRFRNYMRCVIRFLALVPRKLLFAQLPCLHCYGWPD